MMNIAQLMQRMIAVQDGSLHDINHLLKVWGYARTIGMLEGLNEETQFILEAAAITHDIACPLCRRLYGSAAPALQEREGVLLVRSFLECSSLPAETIDRISFLIGHHHTLSAIDSMDFQILIEADYLVNADECGYPPEAICAFAAQHFKTSAGTALLRSVYPQAFL